MKNIYFHIPYCERVCHYCDFAKTAHFGAGHLSAYADHLKQHFKVWRNITNGTPDAITEVESVYFGGGTPSLLTKEYADLFSEFSALLQPKCEITLEANPEHITSENLKIWKDIGFNRISLGIQTFDPIGLQFLTRSHSSDKAKAAIELCLRYFANVSSDLIYGWPGQTVNSLSLDLQVLTGLGIPHISTYCLTYEPRTVIGRRKERGLLQESDEAREFSLYMQICDTLRSHQFDHYEISNFCQPSYRSRHNSAYWTDTSYLGVGSGAHGYLRGWGENGLRYAYPGSDRTFLRQSFAEIDWNSLPTKLTEAGLEVETMRKEDWFLERLSCGLRTKEGLHISLLELQCSRPLQSTPLIKAGFADGFLIRNGDNIRLSESEWFREHAWTLAFANAFYANHENSRQ